MFCRIRSFTAKLFLVVVVVDLQLCSWEEYQVWRRDGGDHTGRLRSYSHKPRG